MKLADFSSVIQLLSAFYFGFLGLQFIYKYFKPLLDSIEPKNKKVKIFYDNIDDKTPGKEIDKNVVAALFWYRSSRFSILAKQTFMEIFVKAGLFSVFLLISLAVESHKDLKTYNGIFLVTLYFITHTIIRCLPFFKKVRRNDMSANLMAKKPIIFYEYGQDMPLYRNIVFNHFYYKDEKKEIKISGAIFLIKLILLFHLPLFFTFPIQLPAKFVIIFVIIVLFLPYLILFAIDTYMWRVLSKLGNVLDSENVKNEKELDDVIDDIISQQLNYSSKVPQ
jgi:hypothetical protein